MTEGCFIGINAAIPITRDTSRTYGSEYVLEIAMRRR